MNLFAKRTKKNSRLDVGVQFGKIQSYALFHGYYYAWGLVGSSADTYVSPVKRVKGRPRLLEQDTWQQSAM